MGPPRTRIEATWPLRNTTKKGEENDEVEMKETRGDVHSESSETLWTLVNQICWFADLPKPAMTTITATKEKNNRLHRLLQEQPSNNSRKMKTVDWSRSQKRESKIENK